MRAFPDTLVGTDSHTTMVNGLGVLGWGVGGIEAEAAMLGQPMSMLIPPVLGFKLVGAMPEGATATDLVLMVTERLRKHGVVGKFVEFFGSGLANLTIADRATLGNMCPEYGATAAMFPIDEMTLDYLTLTGRSASHVKLVEAYAKAQGLFREAGTEAVYDETIELDLGLVEPSLAGPKRPQDRVSLTKAKIGFQTLLPSMMTEKKGEAVERRQRVGGRRAGASGGPPEGGHDRSRRCGGLDHGAVVVAAITSCTNTSNPSVMIGAGLLAKKAVERGLTRRPWVKTSLAPGSKVVTDYLDKAGLTPYLDALGFNLVGYGCTTCIGNSGPLPEDVSAIVAGEKPGRLLGVERQPQFRRTHSVAGARELSRVAAARRRVCARRSDDARPDDRADRERSRRQGRVSARNLADRARDSSGDAERGQVGDVSAAVRQRLRGRRALALAAGADRQSVRMGSAVDLRAQAAVRRGHQPRAGAAHRHHERARARPARRQRDDRPHLAGRIDPGRQPGWDGI